MYFSNCENVTLRRSVSRDVIETNSSISTSGKFKRTGVSSRTFSAGTVFTTMSLGISLRSNFTGLNAACYTSACTRDSSVSKTYFFNSIKCFLSKNYYFKERRDEENAKRSIVSIHSIVNLQHIRIEKRIDVEYIDIYSLRYRL